MALLIYKLIFLVYSQVMRIFFGRKADIWYRNSLALKYLKFGKSDIDVTIVLNKNDTRLIERMIIAHNRLKLFLPVLGEIVFYSKEDWEILANYINYFELKRDPTLMRSTFPQRDLQGHFLAAEKIVFLSKFIWANWLGFKNGKIRPDKIKKMGEIVGLEILTIADLKKEFSNLFPGWSEANWEEVDRIMNSKKIDHISPEAFCLCYNFIGFNHSHLKLTVFQQKILQKVLEWEIWGIYSYQYFAQNDTKAHMKNLLYNAFNLIDPEVLAKMYEHSKMLGVV